MSVQAGRDQYADKNRSCPTDLPPDVDLKCDAMPVAGGATMVVVTNTTPSGHFISAELVLPDGNSVQVYVGDTSGKSLYDGDIPKTRTAPPLTKEQVIALVQDPALVATFTD